MAAQAEVYTSKKLPVHIVGVAKFDSYLALKLAIYGANIKSLFYLDILLVIKNDAGSVLGFLGAIEDNPSAYTYRQHSSARFSKIRLKAPNGKKYIVLNDAGLNTKGEVLSLSLSSALEVGGFRFDSIFKSGYYVASDAYVRFKKNGEVSWADAFKFRSIPENVTHLEDDRFVNLDDYYNVAVGQIYDVQIYISNSEGVTYSDIKTVTVQPYSIMMRSGANPADAYNDTTLSTVYPSTRSIDLGTVLYEVYPDLPYAGGHWMDANTGAYYIIDLNGVVTSKGAYSPTSDLSYNESVIRNSTGSKFGDYSVEVNIVNGAGFPHTAVQVIIEVGKLNGSGVMTEVMGTHTFPSIQVGASSSSIRTDGGYIEEDYLSFSWGYRIFHNGVQVQSGNL